MLRLIGTLQQLAEREGQLASSFRRAGRFEIAARHQARAAAFEEAAALAAQHAVIEAEPDTEEPAP
jgi:hypothetical protein